jgi:hypothetical protein
MVGEYLEYRQSKEKEKTVHCGASKFLPFTLF